MGGLLAKLTGPGPLIDVEGVQCCNRTEVVSETSGSSQGSVGDKHPSEPGRPSEAGRPTRVWAAPALGLPAR